jgi:hypothetical protein
VNLDELRRELRDATELEDSLTEVYFSARPGPTKRHAKFFIPFQKELVKFLQAATELRENGHIPSKRKRELEAVIKDWNEDLRQKYTEALEDVRRWQSPSQKDADSSSPQPRQQTKVKWTGTVRDFGDWVLNAYHDGKIIATSDMNALEQLCEHFLQKDGSPLNARSIKQNLNNRYNQKKPA